MDSCYTVWKNVFVKDEVEIVSDLFKISNIV